MSVRTWRQAPGGAVNPRVCEAVSCCAAGPGLWASGAISGEGISGAQVTGCRLGAGDKVRSSGEDGRWRDRPLC